MTRLIAAEPPADPAAERRWHSATRAGLWSRCCDLMARLPISSAVESLNVSNAAAVALYELARRRD